eukprot:s2010_g14.t1
MLWSSEVMGACARADEWELALSAGRTARVPALPALRREDEYAHMRLHGHVLTRVIKDPSPSEDSHYSCDYGRKFEDR